MNQTTIGGFRKQHQPPQIGSIQHIQENGSHPQTKKFLDQIEKIYSTGRRTDSTGGQRQVRPTTDSNASYGNAQLNTLQQESNSSPTSNQSRVINMANSSTIKGSGEGQTYFMADRIKKKHGVFLKSHHNRHGSVDDKADNIIISSTNDSRVEDILPNVSGGGGSQPRHGTKSVQMRQTMYNNSYFQKLLSNIQTTTAGIAKLQSTIDQHTPILNIVDMKKKVGATVEQSPAHIIQPSSGSSVANAMIKTSYGSSGFNAGGMSMHSNIISKALA